MAKKKPNSDESEAMPLSGTKSSKVNKKRKQVLTQEESDHLELLIRNKIETHIKRKTYDEKSINELQSLLQEHLDCFIVVGYNFQGEPVNMLSVENQQQADSLGTSLHRLMMNLPRGPLDSGSPHDPGY